MLALVTVLVACVGPFLDGTSDLRGWRIFPTVIAPAIMLILAFVLPLDITMARIFLSDASGDRRRELMTAIRVEAWLMLVLLLAWSPFFVRFFELSFPAGD
ncbi:MAG: hypothetical protein AB7O21_09410 [Gammaproteobacteria bacterium]